MKLHFTHPILAVLLVSIATFISSLPSNNAQLKKYETNLSMYNVESSNKTDTLSECCFKPKVEAYFAFSDHNGENVPLTKEEEEIFKTFMMWNINSSIPVEMQKAEDGKTVYLISTKQRKEFFQKFLSFNNDYKDLNDGSLYRIPSQLAENSPK